MTAARARCITRFVTNRLTDSIDRHCGASLQIAALLSLVSRNDNLGCEHDGVWVRLNDNCFRLRNHWFFIKVSRSGLLGHGIYLRTVLASRCGGLERAYFVAQLDHDLRLRGNARIASLNTLILNGSVEEWREFSNRSEVGIVIGLQICRERRFCPAVYRYDLLIIIMIIVIAIRFSMVSSDRSHATNRTGQ